MIRKLAAKSKLNSVDITPTFERQNGFFWRRDALRMHFTVLENVTN